MKKEEHIGKIIFTDLTGQSNTVCFRNMASEILTDSWSKDFSQSLKVDRTQGTTGVGEQIICEICCSDFENDLSTGTECLQLSLRLQMEYLFH